MAHGTALPSRDCLPAGWPSHGTVNFRPLKRFRNGPVSHPCQIPCQALRINRGTHITGGYTDRYIVRSPLCCEGKALQQDGRAADAVIPEIEIIKVQIIRKRLHGAKQLAKAACHCHL